MSSYIQCNFTANEKYNDQCFEYKNEILKSFFLSEFPMKSIAISY